MSGTASRQVAKTDPETERFGVGQMVYSGEYPCQRSNCRNLAHYSIGAEYLCGTHSRSAADRVVLPKKGKSMMAEEEAARLRRAVDLADRSKEDNQKQGRRGQVILTRLRMMRKPDHIDGYLSVFPNYKHGNRSDGLGMNRLSPKSLGPVDHGQPGLPPALNVENFHQGSKCFSQEVGEDGNPNQLYYDNRLMFYQDSEPHRHKYKGTGKNVNIPKYFVWVDREGKEHHLNYVTSRQFYCNFFERLVKVEPQYTRLVDLIHQGYNLNLIGYDASPIEASQIEEAYLKPGLPFGHEKVLFAMLSLEESDYPWRKHKTYDF